MRKEQIREIFDKVGDLDAPQLIKILENLGVGEDVILSKIGSISIPKTSVTDLASLQVRLGSLSKAGRSFEILEEGDRLIIDTIQRQSSYTTSAPTFEATAVRGRRIVNEKIFYVESSDESVNYGSKDPSCLLGDRNDEKQGQQAPTLPQFSNAAATRTVGTAAATPTSSLRPSSTSK